MSRNTEPDASEPDAYTLAQALLRLPPDEVDTTVRTVAPEVADLLLAHQQEHAEQMANRRLNETVRQVNAERTRLLTKDQLRARTLAKSLTRRKFRQGSRCGAWARNRKARCRGWAMPNGRCRHHGGKSTGPRTDEGKARVGAASARDWAAWRTQLGLPPDWRYVQSRRRGGRQTAAQWLAEHGAQEDGEA